MVSHPGAPVGARALRPLSTPAALQVSADAEGRPVAVRKPRWARPRAVARVQDRWRIDDEWWRDRPISRLYYAVLLEGDLLLTLYHDLVGGGWYEQRG